MPTLNELPPGTHATIVSLAGPPALVQRLLELGLMEGEEIQVLTRAPLGDPIEIESGMTRLGIRKAEAIHIVVSSPN